MPLGIEKFHFDPYFVDLNEMKLCNLKVKNKIYSKAEEATDVHPRASCSMFSTPFSLLFILLGFLLLLLEFFILLLFLLLLQALSYIFGSLSASSCVAGFFTSFHVAM